MTNPKSLSPNELSDRRDEMLDTIHMKWGNSITLRDLVLILCSISSHMAYDCAPSKIQARRLLDDGIKLGRLMLKYQNKLEVE